MPFLRVEQGSCPGQLLEIDGERIVIGRHPGCEIVLDNAAVSRQHAQISESHGTYFLEDLRSRNRTYLNGKLVESSAELHDGDTIHFCDLTFRFLLDPPQVKQVPIDEAEPGATATALPTAARGADLTVRGKNVALSPRTNDPATLSESGSSILSTVPIGDASSLLLAIKPEQKLRAVLDIGRALGHALELDQVLERAVEGLFRVFPQADHGYILFEDGRDNKLQIRIAKSRRPEHTSPSVSMTVVRRAMQAGEAVLSADLTDDPRFSNSESIASMSLRSVMCVPLYSQREEPFGVVQLDSADVTRPFTKDDLDILASVTGQIGLAIENARLHSELVAQRDMERELEFAMQVQLGFLPSHPPEVPHYEFFDHYEAAQRVGGDYFDYVELPDGRIAVTVGDVAGKGVPAALLMARLFASARYQLLTRATPGEALGALNSEIARTALGHRFITCLFAILDPKTNIVTVANAGHMAPLIRSADGKVAPLGQKESGMPIGIARDQAFSEVSCHLAPGDLLLMYTDGVTEAMDSSSELYGRPRLVKLIESSPPSIRELIEGIVADVASFAGDRSQRDDICLVGFRRLLE